MEWTGVYVIEYQLTKIAKTHHCGHGKVVSAVPPMLASTGLLCLASVSSLVPRPTRGMFCVWMRLYVLAVWMSGDVCVNWNKPKACRT